MEAIEMFKDCLNTVFGLMNLEVTFFNITISLYMIPVTCAIIGALSYLIAKTLD